MRYQKRIFILSAACIAALQLPLAAQPPAFGPGQLDQMVARIALYPDPLLAQVLAAATFPDQIQPAAGWSDQHHYLTGEALAAAISGDRLPWDPSLQALLPFPSVLDMMANDMGWTSDLGNAFLTQREEIMDAVQRQRQVAMRYGYLRSNPQIVVRGGPYVEIVPVNPAFVCVPVYDPFVVYAAPRAGFFVGGAINFGFGVTIGAAFRPWGWGYNRFGWSNHTVIVNNVTWNRTYINRTTYVHPYQQVQRYQPPARIEQHELHTRTETERGYARSGHEHVEEHHYERHDDYHEGRHR